MTQKYRISDMDGGYAAAQYAFKGFTFAFSIGEYDVLHQNDTDQRWAVVCCPTRRKPDCWNATEFDVDDRGNLTFLDEDVELDPYHMCLLYQAIESQRKEEKK